MNVNELKVGNRIKSYDTEGRIQYGNIKTINKYWITFCDEWGVYPTRPDLVISKLEPQNHILPTSDLYQAKPIYKEIIIDHLIKKPQWPSGGVIPEKEEYKQILSPTLDEISHDYKEFEKSLNNTEDKVTKCFSTNYIKISDLKIGDKIKFFSPYCGMILEGNITNVSIAGINISTNNIREFIPSSRYDDIICKLELLPINSQIRYREIPVEKEDNSGRYYLCKKCNSSTFIKENTELNREKFLNYLCKECKNKEKSAPKSFKFDYLSSGYDYWIPNKPTWMKIGKTYTIEIKEKE